MKLRNVYGISACLLSLSGTGFAEGEPALSNDYKNAALPIEERVEALLSQMTLEEKALQLSQGVLGQDYNVNNLASGQAKDDPRMGSMICAIEDPERRNAYQKFIVEKSRLGIPMIFGYDVIHGFKTIFPAPLAQACSWNPELVREGCIVAAKECKSAGIDWTFSPMIDIGRDPRWGRVVEGYGEDPYATGVFAAAAVKGYQGETVPYRIAACLKHFVGYGESEGGRDYAYTDISRQALWETYLPPYEAGVKAGARTLMGAFNDICGVPASANPYTLKEVLRNKWGFTGFVVSDWSSIRQLMNQGYAANPDDCVKKALEAGLDMEMVDGFYKNSIPSLVKSGAMELKYVDDAVRNVLRVKFELGLFENPYVDVKPASERLLLPQYKAKARQMAVESMVLLKNKDNILPLSPALKDIALIGPLVKDRNALMGSWRGRGEDRDVVDIEEGLKKVLPASANLHYAKGCDVNAFSDKDCDEAVAIAGKSEIILLCLGETAGMNGENASRSTISLTEPQQKLLFRLTELKKPIVLLLATGRPTSLHTIEPQVAAILVTWHPGSEAGNAVADLLTGRESPSGRLAITFPCTEGQIPMYYNMRNRARPYQGKYQDLSTEPMYWFGDGLGYTTYEYGTPALSTKEITMETPLSVSVDVKNTGKRAGKETVFLYIHDKVASISQPVKRLIAFEKIDLQPGESKTVSFTVDPVRDLSFANSEGRKILEPGEFEIIIKDKKETIVLK